MTVKHPPFAVSEDRFRDEVFEPRRRLVNMMGLISISAFSGCRKQIRLIELFAVCVLIGWFLLAVLDEAIFRSTDDEATVLSRFFRSDGGDYDGDKMKYNRSCYNNDDIHSRALFPETILGERGCKQGLPTVVVTGVKHCKTDILTSLLRHHPHLVFPKTDDVSYFSDYFDLGTSWYRRQMGHAVDSQRIAESSPTYFTDSDVPKRVRSELGRNNTKFIVLFCDPVVRALREARAMKEEQVQMFRDMEVEAISADVAESIENRPGHTWSLGSSIRVNKTSNIIQNGIYINFFREWYKHFPTSSFFMLGEKRLLDETEDSLLKIETFLQLPSYFGSKMFRDPVYNYVCIRNNFARFDPFCFTRGVESFGSGSRGLHSENSGSADKTHLNSLRTFYKPYNDKLQSMFLVPVL